MGMTASQARFLCLTARKSNIEFEGQQINQQRTTLSNQSASYYSELCNMVVPTPPSVDDFTKVSYTFDDGAMTNTITSMIAKRGQNGQNIYSISYIQQWQDDYAVKPAASSMISKEGSNYKIGATTLRKLGEQSVSKEYVTVGNAKHDVFRDTEGKPFYYKDGKTVSELNNISGDNRGFYKWTLDENDNARLDDNSAILPYNGQWYEKADITHSKPIDVNKLDKDYFFTDGVNQSLISNTNLYVRMGDDGYWFKASFGDNSIVSNPAKVYIDESLVSSEKTSAVSTDKYLSSLDEQQLEDLKEQEAYYKKLLNAEYNAGQNGEWFVRYSQNATTGAYVPYFYKAGFEGGKNGDGVLDSNYSDGFANISCYSIGAASKTQEVLNRTGTIEKDSSGRYISITIYPDDTINEKGITYNLVTKTSTDEDAYNDAMNQYSYDQAKYDKKVQDINSRLEIVQQQDKTLELNLKHLDTEENAVKTEIDAIQAVIKDNVSKSFKTFQG